MYFVYIIKSEKSGKYYIGVTSNLIQRLRHHNSGANKSTKNRGPWLLVFQENFNDKKSAWLREKQIKSYNGGEAFKKLIKN
ncbi:MAG: endonuclease [Candidatus Moranbacteria bacterium CG10_big_fil_rev_8_21_14_0_10_35_21]|nr:MAG: endonuclease [Candidatus Moranbacteria bacterium CG10_big_fil_rev_8_21_14_0_10_35_21]PJA88230.1 MAG: endonuclease [Candidatus Moranbacteria bacterium CG_4_9_14_3_um_filter_36_9]